MDGIHAELSARALDWNVHCLHCAPTLSSVHFDGLRAAATGLTPSRWREQAPGPTIRNLADLSDRFWPNCR